MISFLREAADRLGGILTVDRYDAFARRRHCADGRPWPTKQVASKRFGSWHDALIRAGLHANPSTASEKRRKFSESQCVQAVLRVRDALGSTPTIAEYDRFVRQSRESLPSSSTVRNRCGGWENVLDKAGL